jgi:hypothetical protein
MGLWWYVIFIGYGIIMWFPYKRFMVKKYEFNPLGWPLYISMGLVMVYMVAMMALGFEAMWPIPLLMIPGFAIMTVNLLKKTKEPLIIIINTVLMLLLYALMVIATAIVLVIVIGLIVLTIGLRLVGRGGRGGGFSAREQREFKERHEQYDQVGKGPADWE